MRVLPAGSRALLVEVADLDETLALFTSLDEDPVPGVEELVPAARTVLVRFDPLRTTAADVAAQVRSRPLTTAAADDGPVVRVPVTYDGEDLADVASLCGLDAAEVVRRHTAAPWTVAFTGFAPGFAYLAGGDPALDVPRRTTPRTSIPAGSVALAGRFSGVYPRASPGGWQLIGRTALAMWDLDREEPALLRPGMRVQFVETTAEQTTAEQNTAERHAAEGTPAELPPPTSGPRAPEVTGRAVEVLTPGASTVLEDLGRPGRSALGVSRSGAMDRAALRRANRLVGNPAGAPALESAGGLRLRARGNLVLALAGAPAALTVRTSSGGFEIAPGTAFALDDGEELHLASPARGALSYLAVRGSFAVEPLLGSASTDVLSGLGPPPLRPGDVLPVGARAVDAVALDEDPGPPVPARGDVVEVDVVPGPRDDWFTPAAVDLFHRQEWTLTPRSNRVGLRLSGEVALERAVAGELPSEGTVPGAVQVPPDGQPVVFTADHPVTGGYPVIACVAAHHLDLVGQVPAGARIRFRPAPPLEGNTP